MAAYVIKSWRAADQPDVDGNYVTIIGRKEGIISWLLALFRIDPIVSISVNATRIEFSEGSLSGTVRRLIPLPSVSSTLYGYYKPWKKALVIFYLLSGITAALPYSSSERAHSPIINLIFGLLVGLIVSIIYYLYNRTLSLGFVENSGVVSAIQFKRSFVENKDINDEQARYVCQLVQFFVESRYHGAMQQP